MIDRLQNLLAVGRGSEPAEIAEAIRGLATRHRWMVPVLWIGQTIDALVAGVLLLLRNWRLFLIEIVPALWLGAITWDWRERTLGRLPLAEVHGAIAVGVTVFVVLATLVAYWCNATFAFAAVQPPPADVGLAWNEAKSRRRMITGWALAAGVAHAFVVVILTRTNVVVYSFALGAIVVLQMYALVAIPVALVTEGHRDHVSRRVRLSRMLVLGTLTGVAVTPGFLLNRLAVLMFAIGLPWLGVVLIVPAVLVQAAGAASAKAVVLATKVQEVAVVEGHARRHND